jgi:phosphoribosylaminoimidazole (AIR) synthetase
LYLKLKGDKLSETYKSAGVDIKAGEETVESNKAACKIHF